MSMRLKPADTPEAQAAAERDTAIDAFVSDPAYGQGTAVRAAGYGTREFSFGGGSVYTWSADQEKADRAKAAGIDNGKSFAELLNADLPSREAMAAKLWEAGDRDGATAELASIDKFVSDNRDTLRTLSMYQGSHDLSAQVSGKAAALLTGAYRVPFAAMDRDPEIKAKVAHHITSSMGLDTEASDVYAGAMVDKDPESMALWRAAGAPTQLETPAGSAGSGVTPKAAKAAAVGVDTGMVNGFLKYAGPASAKLLSDMPSEVTQLMSPDARARILRSSFDNGDRESSGAVLGVISSAVNTAAGVDPQGKANIAESTVKTVASAQAAWGHQDDPLGLARGAKTLAALQPLLPGARLSANSNSVSDVLAYTSKTIDGAASFGRQVSDAGSARLARIKLASSLNMTQSLDPSEQKIKGGMDTLHAVSANTRADLDYRLPLDKQGKQVAGETPQQRGSSSMFNMQKSSVDMVLELASVDMAETGVDLQTAVDRNIKPLGDTLLSQGAVSQGVADATAKFMMRHLIANNGGDLTTLANDIRAKRGDLAQLEVNGLGKAPVDIGAGLPRRAAAEARARVASPIDKAVYDSMQAVSSGQWDFKPGAGEWNALRSGTKKALIPLADSLVSPGSDMYKVLADTPLADLDTPAVREAALAALVNQAKTSAPRSATFVDDAIWADIGGKIVDRTLRGMLGKVGVHPGATGLAASLSASISSGSGVGASTYRDIMSPKDNVDEPLTARPVSGFHPMPAPGASTEELRQSAMSASDLARDVLVDALSASILGKAVGGVNGSRLGGAAAATAETATAAALAGAAVEHPIKKGLERAAEIAALDALDRLVIPVKKGAGAAAEQAAMDAMENASVLVKSVGARQVAGAVAGGAGSLAALGSIAYAMGLDRAQPVDGSNIAVNAKRFADSVFMGPPPAMSPMPMGETMRTTGLDTPFGPGAVAAKAATKASYGDLFLDPKFKIEDVMATLDTVVHNSRATAEFAMENDLVFNTLPGMLDKVSVAKRMEVQNDYFNARRTGKVTSLDGATELLIKNVSKVEKAIERGKLDYLSEQTAIRLSAKKDASESDATALVSTPSDAN